MVRIIGEKKYKWNWSEDVIPYIVRFNMALDYDPEVTDPQQPVCTIKIVFRYADIDNDNPSNWHMEESVFRTRTLKVSDFDAAHNFTDFYFDGPNDGEYVYPPLFLDPTDPDDKIQELSEADTTYSDVNADNGIQYVVDWLGVGALYINKVEAYDRMAWKQYIDFPGLAMNQIESYANDYSNWDNMKFWYASDEPSSIDAFSPMHTVDEILNNAGSVPLITDYYPRAEIIINGDTLMKQFVQIAKPTQLMVDDYPISPYEDPPMMVRMESLRKQFAVAHSIRPGFWYVAQAFGEQMADGTWCGWRLPDSTELKSTVMLALAHGIKGLIFYKYLDAGPFNNGKFACIGNYWERGIIGQDLNPTPLWNLIKNNLVPRLKGTLGSTLFGLDYTGTYVHILQRFYYPT